MSTIGGGRISRVAGSGIRASIDRLEKLGHNLGDQFNGPEVAPLLTPIGCARPEMAVLVGPFDHDRRFCGSSIHRAHNPPGRKKFCILI